MALTFRVYLQRSPSWQACYPAPSVGYLSKFMPTIVAAAASQITDRIGKSAGIKLPDSVPSSHALVDLPTSLDATAVSKTLSAGVLKALLDLSLLRTLTSKTQLNPVPERNPNSAPSSSVGAPATIATSSEQDAKAAQVRSMFTPIDEVLPLTRNTDDGVSTIHRGAGQNSAVALRDPAPMPAPSGSSLSSQLTAQAYLSAGYALAEIIKAKWLKRRARSRRLRHASRHKR